MTVQETIALRPTPARLARATIAAIGVAAVILLTIVLPAEYGLDPLGTGRVLGLMRSTALDDSAAGLTKAQGLIPLMKGPATYYAQPFALDHEVFQLGPYEFMEYKYRLEQGAAMTFAWDASAAVIHDFHGVPDQPRSPQEKEVSFEKQPRRSGYGSHVAPFSGLHGWYWENEGPEPVTITLSSAGYFAQAIEVVSGRNRRTHEMTPLRSLEAVWPPLGRPR